MGPSLNCQFEGTVHNSISSRKLVVPKMAAKLPQFFFERVDGKYAVEQSTKYLPAIRELAWHITPN